eukprot:SAG25_NODE_170_length_13039_cov_23.733153_15_plen_99_part_00
MAECWLVSEEFSCAATNLEPEGVRGTLHFAQCSSASQSVSRRRLGERRSIVLAAAPCCGAPNASSPLPAARPQLLLCCCCCCALLHGLSDLKDLRYTK